MANNHINVISQQVNAIDQGILTQLNTQITMVIGNLEERRTVIRNTSSDLNGIERELQVMGKGPSLITASYKYLPLPVMAPEFGS